MTKKVSSPLVEESRIIHGLLHRKTGKMLRVETREEMRYGEMDKVYHLSLDSDWPLFDAGSATALAEVFARGGGSSEYTPHLGDFKPDSVEPVLMRETINRSFEALQVEFEIPVVLKISFATDVTGAIREGVEGFREIVEIVDGFANELKTAEGAQWRGSPHNLVALLVHQHISDLSHVTPGVRISSGMNGYCDRRALAVLPVPPDQVEMLAGPRQKVEAMSWIACLADARRLPDGLAKAMEERAAGTSPAPAP